MTVDVARYDSAPGDEARYETAIARRNTTWARLREAEALLVAAARQHTYVRNRNEALDDYERAAYDLVRARASWREHGR